MATRGIATQRAESSGNVRLSTNSGQEILRGVPALWSPRNQANVGIASDAEEFRKGELPAWSLLAKYYAATQRKDPRGRVKEFVDRHGLNWHLWWTSGAWWLDAQLRISMEDLPEEFRETLSRRKTTSAAVGWPVANFSTSEGLALMPGLLFPVEYRIDGPNLIIDFDRAEPIINPAWLDEILRRTAWSESGFLEKLLPEGEDTDLGVVSDRLRHALAKLGGSCLRPGSVAPELSLNNLGLSNAAGLFLPDDTTFTRGAAEDLEAMSGWETTQIAGTALQALLKNEAIKSDDLIPVLQATPRELLTDSQMEAARSALSGPLTLIQGPPGTGKSQVILSLIVSAVLNGRTVLFAAKNHQAIDEVERRLAELLPDAQLLTRARDAEGERNSSFIDALFELSRSETRDQLDQKAEETRLSLIQQGQVFADEQRKANERLAIELELSDLTDKLNVTAPALLAKSNTKRTSILFKLLRKFKYLFVTRTRITPQLGHNASTIEIKSRIDQLRVRLASWTKGEITTPEPLKEFASKVAAALPILSQFITRPNHEEWRLISDRARELDFARIKSAKRMSAEDARLVLQHRPIWAISTLSVNARIPLVPGLFDYVIFDEASQCDIASALPLFARARRAVVVGDPLQLRFIPQLSNASEHALMDAAGIPAGGRAFIAQSTNSLFDFCDGRPSIRRMFLADQFRSAPQIVDYLNSEFYSGRLIGRRDLDNFKPPNGYRPGLAWDDVAGHAVRVDEGTINRPEAEALVRLVKRFAFDPTFSGSVGVVSPFNAQVGEIQKRLNADLTPIQQEKLSLRVATVDKFQGGEADVILFSPVLCASAPRSAWTFLQKERRRLNVAISRARALCLIVGDLSYARTCGIRHIEFLAKRATTPWTPYRPQQFDSDWERRLDVAMRARGLNPISQFPVGSRFLDFALDPETRKLNVEVDGRRWHIDSSGNRKVSDRLRDAELRSRGWKILRFWVHELAYDMEGCLDRIERELGRR